jgi:hypothetical protein
MDFLRAHVANGMSAAGFEWGCGIVASHIRIEPRISSYFSTGLRRSDFIPRKCALI